MPRKYDKNGRELLQLLCNGKGADVGCNQVKITADCIGVDNDAAAHPDIIAAMDSLPFSDGELDFIVSSHCLEHAPDVVKVLAEWARVLRTGGKVGVAVPHGEYTIAATLGDASGTHRQLFTPKTLQRFLEHAGFVNVISEEYQRSYAYKQTPGIFARGEKR